MDLVKDAPLLLAVGIAFRALCTELEKAGGVKAEAVMHCLKGLESEARAAATAESIDTANALRILAGAARAGSVDAALARAKDWPNDPQ